MTSACSPATAHRRMVVSQLEILWRNSRDGTVCHGTGRPKTLTPAPLPVGEGLRFLSFPTSFIGNPTPPSASSTYNAKAPVIPDIFYRESSTPTCFIHLQRNKKTPARYRPPGILERCRANTAWRSRVRPTRFWRALRKTSRTNSQSRSLRL